MNAGESEEHRAPSAEHEPDYRFSLANERTFLAWIRTTLGLLAGAVAVVTLAPDFGFDGARHVAGALLASMGVAVALGAVRRWHAVQTAMRRDEELPSSWMPVLLASGLGVLSVLIVVLLLIPRNG
ncbi:MAG: YidH family protein [Sciscionella sp.]